MPKLHEILAVEDGLQTTAKRINDETIKTFDKKDEHFVGTTKVLTHFDAGDEKLNVTEHKAMVTTVLDKLIYFAGPNIKAIDARMTKDATNQKAHADLIVDDVVLAKDVPSTTLLALETRLAELRLVYEKIPTLAPGPTWELDRTARSAGGVYRSVHPDVNFKTRKTVKPIVMSPATEHHPAQIQAVQEDTPIGRFTTTHESGMMTSADKSTLLGRLDKLLRAVKRARQRANGTDVVKREIGKVLFDHLHDGIVA